jgi:hypothetical protein
MGNSLSWRIFNAAINAERFFGKNPVTRDVKKRPVAKRKPQYLPRSICSRSRNTIRGNPIRSLPSSSHHRRFQNVYSACSASAGRGDPAG